MKTIVKMIWFSLAITLSNYALKYVTIDNINNSILDKLNAPDFTYKFTNDFLSEYAPNMSTILFFTIMFLGLDVISGEIKGVIRGPFKILFNTIFYLIGFTILFYIFGISITFNK